MSGVELVEETMEVKDGKIEATSYQNGVSPWLNQLNRLNIINMFFWFFFILL